DSTPGCRRASLGPAQPGLPLPAVWPGCPWLSSRPALGCPTANMPAETLAPGGRPSQFGVFCGWAALAGEGDADSIGEPHPAVLSWGVNPQFGLDKPLFEVHLIGLQCEAAAVPGHPSTARRERNFPGGLDELRRAIELDMATACRLLADRTPAEAAELLAQRVAACGKL
uniref:riboflavin kinase n=1 Tax=Macrostomum lignano TaxID=282301 RepID=A0A1I8IY15_9PLAT